jgi:enamine deaminase RidA (YjgF/YER057c/UK114 family)
VPVQLLNPEGLPQPEHYVQVAVAKLTVYVVDWSPEKLAQLGEGVARVAERLGVDPRKPITLLGVAALGEPDLLVEVEAVAVLA